MNLLDVIKQLCDEKGINLAILQRELGFSNNVINRWDKVTPGVDKLSKVADYFNVSTDYLLGRTERYQKSCIEPQEPKISHKIKVLARNLDELPDEDREKLIKNFEDTIDIYLQARGIQLPDDNRKK